MCIDPKCMFYWKYIHYKIKIRRTNLQNVILLSISVSEGPGIHIPSVLWLVTGWNWILIIGKIERSFILCRGGLAERLCRLQNRERSAISFWRHRCISDAKIPSGKKCCTAVWKYILTCVYIWPTQGYDWSLYSLCLLPDVGLMPSWLFSELILHFS